MPRRALLLYPDDSTGDRRTRRKQTSEVLSLITAHHTRPNTASLSGNSPHGQHRRSICAKIRKVMPIYTYHCADCLGAWDRLAHMRKPKTIVCPQCGATAKPKLLKPEVAKLSYTCYGK